MKSKVISLPLKNGKNTECFNATVKLTKDVENYTRKNYNNKHDHNLKSQR